MKKKLLTLLPLIAFVFFTSCEVKQNAPRAVQTLETSEAFHFCQSPPVGDSELEERKKECVAGTKYPEYANYINSKSKNWDPAQIVAISFTKDSPPDRIETFKRDIISELKTFCGFKYEFVDSFELGLIRIHIGVGLGSWSAVGTDALLYNKADHTMQFGWVDFSGAMRKHELGHGVFAWHHEHAKQEIDSLKAKDHYLARNNWTLEQWHSFYTINLKPDLSDYFVGPYDPMSIMDYRLACEILIDKTHCTLPFPTVFSTGDRNRAALQFPINGTPVGEPIDPTTTTCSLHKLTPTDIRLAEVKAETVRVDTLTKLLNEFVRCEH